MFSLNRWFVVLGLCGAVVPAHADVMANAPQSDYPDLVLSAISFSSPNSSATTHSYPITTGAAAPVTLKLGAGTPTGANGSGICWYSMTFDALNAGPSTYYSSAGNTAPGTVRVAVGASITFPDGSSTAYDGFLQCPGDALFAGDGCSSSESLLLAEGTTRVTWTLDPKQTHKEFSESNNVYKVNLVVGPNCEPAASAQWSPRRLTSEAMAQSRDSLARAFTFRSVTKAIKRPVPRSAPRR